MKDYRIEVRVKNNYILQMMESRGIVSVAELSRQMNEKGLCVCVNVLGHVVNLKVSAYNSRTGDTTPVVEKLCAFFNCDVSDIFPPQNITNPLSINKGTFEANYDEIPFIGCGAILESPEQVMIENEKKDILWEKVDGRLSKREAYLLKERFINGKTINEMMEPLGNISKSRVSQIEQKALRKLSNPSLGLRNLKCS